MELKRNIGLFTAVCVIVGNMIGTGIFGTTGYALADMGQAGLVLVLWLIGGAAAIAGALSYAELASIWPEVGGEYVYLKNTFGKLPAFMTGWVSLTVGFSAAVAACALVFTEYLANFMTSVAADSLFADAVFQKFLAAGIIVFFSCMHIMGVRRGTLLQNILTVIKVLIVLALVIGGLIAAGGAHTERLSAGFDAQAASLAGGLAWILHPTAPVPALPEIALTLLIVMFAYSGWNASAYIAGEIKDPAKNLPRALFWSAFGIMVVYFLFNIVYLLAVPIEELAGQGAVGAVAAGGLFGPEAARFFSLGIAVILLSAISSQIFIGPRVSYAMARDRMLFRSLGALHERYETPHRAILLQAAVSITYIFLGSAEMLMQYMGFALSVFPLIAVAGLIVLRIRRPDLARPWKVPLFPLFPAIYIALTLIMMIASLLAWTSTSLFALLVLAASVPVYYIWRFFAMTRLDAPRV
ncbi:MAG: amino acid permease [Spirochaetota bacterium]|jgi:APA family basic amino acid/polyamine antiporter|nr:amino acid permease [Spirochaetota bacterium]